MEQGLGFAHFLTQTDGVGKSVLVVLLLLSVASWYLIVTRAHYEKIAQVMALAAKAILVRIGFVSESAAES